MSEQTQKQTYTQSALYIGTYTTAQRVVFRWHFLCFPLVVEILSGICRDNKMITQLAQLLSHWAVPASPAG